MKKALITGSGGLIGSACATLLAEEGWEVVGVDNDMRRRFFGDEGTTTPTVEFLRARFPKQYLHFDLDVRDRPGIMRLFKDEKPDFVVHAAAQPSHDRASAIPYDDFDVNAVGTLNVLQAARICCPESPFCFTSTNKVYGDHPNGIPRLETPTRYDFADGRDGIDESLPLDGGVHSLFGVSKAAADLLCQEYGRYFHMPVGVFRGSCLTGPRHAAVPLHGFLSYIVRCATTGALYTIHGHRGKQVRDQIHSRDVALLFLEFFRAPRAGEVYNLGGGRANSASIVEVIQALEDRGKALQYEYDAAPRIGDHICYISDTSKLRAHFPRWRVTISLSQIIDEIFSEGRLSLACAR